MQQLCGRIPFGGNTVLWMGTTRNATWVATGRLANCGVLWLYPYNRSVMMGEVFIAKSLPSIWNEPFDCGISLAAGVTAEGRDEDVCSEDVELSGKSVFSDIMDVCDGKGGRDRGDTLNRLIFDTLGLTLTSETLGILGFSKSPWGLSALINVCMSSVVETKGLFVIVLPLSWPYAICRAAILDSSLSSNPVVARPFFKKAHEFKPGCVTSACWSAT